jgi:hypothetical protein
MTSFEISRYSLREKLQIMQMIWEDLRGAIEDMEVPGTHKHLLDARRSRSERGESKLLDWTQVKHNIAE